MATVRSEFFYFGICHVCKIETDKLQSCSNCKTVAYCSKQHQKLDWRKHRDLCKAISTTYDNLQQGDQFTYKGWKEFRIFCYQNWTSALKREFEVAECQIWMFPRVCGICYTRNNLNDCPKCRNIAYCSREHAEQHKPLHDKYCKNLKLCMDIDVYVSRGNGYPQMNLSRLIDSFTKLPENMNILLEQEAVLNKDDSVTYALKADMLAPGTTIVHALENYLCDIEPSSKYVIHVVGFSGQEAAIDWRVTFELIFHWTNISNIVLYCIGPVASQMIEDIQLCQMCINQGKVFDFVVFKDFYYNVIDNIPKPNIVIAFNCVLNELQGKPDNQWLKSIPCLIKNNNVPFAFTSYTEDELLLDIDCLKAQCTNLSISFKGQNPFATLRPIRDWCTEEVPLFYSSAYLAIVKSVN